MPALVPELVNAATDASMSLADLLRRALVVARRLDVPELVEWINGELLGYKGKKVPVYRRIRGELVAINPANGVIPVSAPAEVIDSLCDFSMRQPIPELMELMQSKGELFCPLPAETEYRLREMMSFHSRAAMAIRPGIRLSRIQVHGVIEAVRTKVLDWALDLESKGILGEGMMFSPEEKEIVQQHQHYYHLESIHNSQIQIASDYSAQTQTNGDMEALQSLIALLHSVINEGQIKGEAFSELQAELATLQAQADSPKPKWPIIRATAGSIKNVLENAAGGVIAAQALPYLSVLLG